MASRIGARKIGAKVGNSERKAPKHQHDPKQTNGERNQALKAEAERSLQRFSGKAHKKHHGNRAQAESCHEKGGTEGAGKSGCGCASDVNKAAGKEAVEGTQKEKGAKIGLIHQAGKRLSEPADEGNENPVPGFSSGYQQSGKDGDPRPEGEPALSSGKRKSFSKSAKYEAQKDIDG